MNTLLATWTRHEAQLRGWLFEVTRNPLTDRLRAGHKSVPLPDDLEDTPAPQPVTEANRAFCSTTVASVRSTWDRLDVCLALVVRGRHEMAALGRAGRDVGCRGSVPRGKGRHSLARGAHP